MATNPPIVIGPFTNVPAPGSGVKSDWPQQISHLVGDRHGVILVDAPAQTFNTGTIADITWTGAEVSDPEGWAQVGVATLNVPTGKAGRYLFSFQGQWSGAPGASASVAFYHNTVYVMDVTASIGTFPGYGHNLCFLRTLAAGDFFRFSAFQNSGANRDLNSRLEICLVGQ